MNDFSGFTGHDANLKRIHHDVWEIKLCHVENDTTVSRFLSPASMGLILVFTQLFSQNSFPEV